MPVGAGSKRVRQAGPRHHTQANTTTTTRSADPGGKSHWRQDPAEVCRLKLARLEDEAGTEDPRLCPLLARLSAMEARREQHGTATALLKRELHILERQGDADAVLPAIVTALLKLGRCYEHQDLRQNAGASYKLAEAMARRLGAAHPSYASAMYFSGLARHTAGNTQAGLDVLRLAAAAVAAQPDHPLHGNINAALQSVRFVSGDARASAALPVDWRVLHTEAGRPYFVNARTQRTTWVDPRIQGKACRPLPSGWEQAVDGDGHAYYIDHGRRHTQRHHPGDAGEAGRGGDDEEREERLAGSKRDSIGSGSLSSWNSLSSLSSIVTSVSTASYNSARALVRLSPPRPVFETNPQAHAGLQAGGRVLTAAASFATFASPGGLVEDVEELV